jgi:Transcriptional regulator
VKAIIGFELEVTELENVHKLSQNRDEISYRNIIAKLEEQGGDGKYIADRMKENTSELFTGKEEAGNPSR